LPIWLIGDTGQPSRRALTFRRHRYITDRLTKINGIEVAALRIFPGPPRNFRGTPIAPDGDRAARAPSPGVFPPHPQRRRKPNTDKAFRVADYAATQAASRRRMRSVRILVGVRAAAPLFFW